MSKEFVPRDYQKIMINHLVRNKRCALFAGMGVGKTSSVLCALERLNLVDDVYPALVVAPLRVANSVWKQESEKWLQLSHLKVSIVTGNPDERLAALRVPAQIYVTNYDNIKWLVDLLGKKFSFKTIVADELTRLKSFRIRQGGARARELYKVAFPPFAERFYGLTGTPVSNGLKDLHGMVHYLDRGERLGRTYTSFSQRWFQTGWDGFSVEPLPHAQMEIQDKISDICLSIRSEDWFDLEEPIRNVIKADLPPAARKNYDQMQKDLFTKLGEDKIEAFSAAAKTMKLLQFSNGCAYTDDTATTWKEVHDEKIKALESVIEEAGGMPVLVAYHFRSDLTRLSKAFPKGAHLDRKPETIKLWNDGRIPVLFAHPASAGHGIDLSRGSNILVFFSVNWNLEEHLQIIERIGPVRQMQAGLNRSVHLHYILASSTIDEMVMERPQTKRSVQDILLEALKARK